MQLIHHSKQEKRWKQPALTPLDNTPKERE
jgi:hypothetical protein